MALSDSTTPTVAVMSSLLGLASLHRFGTQSHAVRLKVSALQALGASLIRGIGAKEGLQHVAAGMLLCSYEVSQPMALMPRLLGGLIEHLSLL